MLARASGLSGSLLVVLSTLVAMVVLGLLSLAGNRLAAVALVPVALFWPLIDRVSSTDKEEVVLPGGHVSLVAGPNAVKRMWPKLNEWLERRST